MVTGAIFIHETPAVVLSTKRSKEKYFAINIVKDQRFSEQKWEYLLVGQNFHIYLYRCFMVDFKNSFYI
jgi:hypothetical protein